MPIFFDVGANDGSWGISRCKESPANLVYSFEPTPFLIEIIKKNSSSLSNLFIIPKAVSDVSGKAFFNLSQNGDWGCSSLLDFKEKELITEKWPGRDDIGKTGEIEVECVRMDDFCREHSIESIEYFHCDVQGMDLKVLQSFDSMIRIVKAGEIESVKSLDKAIYANQTDTVEDCKKWLRRQGFNVTDEIPNDPYGNEFNIRFEK